MYAAEKHSLHIIEDMHYTKAAAQFLVLTIGNCFRNSTVMRFVSYQDYVIRYDCSITKTLKNKSIPS